MQMDVGFGDAVYPWPFLAEFPVMVDLDIQNSRMKDFYDFWFTAKTWHLEQGLLRSAIAFSFERREMAIPMSHPL
jgi:hypothetical protein